MGNGGRFDPIPHGYELTKDNSTIRLGAIRIPLPVTRIYGRSPYGRLRGIFVKKLNAVHEARF